MVKEKLEEYIKREDLVKRGFTEKKWPISHFFKNENGNMTVYCIYKDNLYKIARKSFP